MKLGLLLSMLIIFVYLVSTNHFYSVCCLSLTCARVVYPVHYIIELRQELLLQVDKMNGRVKALKRQVDEAEEEVTRMNAQKRKIQRDLDDQLELYESANREISQLKKYR